MEIPTPTELREKRLQMGLKQADVARMAGISQSMVARIEAGSVDPRVSTLGRIEECGDGNERRKDRRKLQVCMSVASPHGNANGKTPEPVYMSICYRGMRGRMGAPCRTGAFPAATGGPGRNTRTGIYSRGG